MNKSELLQALAARPPVKHREDAEAVLESLAAIIWHELERGGDVDLPRIGLLSVIPAERGRRAVGFHAATELDVAVNRHHVTA